MAKKCPKDFTELFPHLFRPQRSLTEVGLTSLCNLGQNLKYVKSDRRKFYESSSDDSFLLENSWDAPQPKRKRKIKRALPRKNVKESVTKKKNEQALAKKKVEQSLPKTKVRQVSQKKTIKQSLPKKKVIQAKPKKEPKSKVTNKIAQTSRKKQPKSRALQQKASRLLPEKTKTPSLTLSKNNAKQSVKEPGTNSNIIDFSFVDCSAVKEVINEMLPNVNNHDFVDIKHDLTQLIAGDETLNNSLPLGLPPIIICQSNVQNVHENSKDKKDPLLIGVEEKSATLIKETKRSPKIDKESKTSCVKRDSFKGSCDSINMVHDLTDIIAGDGKLYNSLQFQCSTQNSICKSKAQNTDESDQEDQLAINEKAKSTNSIKDRRRSNDSEGTLSDSFNLNNFYLECLPSSTESKSNTPNADEKSEQEDRLSINEKEKTTTSIKKRTSIDIVRKTESACAKRVSPKSLMIHDLNAINAIIYGDGIFSDNLKFKHSTPAKHKSNSESMNENSGYEKIDEKEKSNNLISKRKRSTDIEKKRKRPHVENDSSKNSSDSDSEGLSKDLLKLLKNMHIKLQHEVPPQHKIENCAGSRPLTEKQLLEFNKYVTLKKGLFTKEEDNTIKSNWINFCKLHNWHEIIIGPFLTMRHENKYYIPSLEERKNFVRFLSNGLPSRSLYSVYNRFKNLYNPTVSSGQFTSKEDEIILRIFQSPDKLKKFVESAKILNRKKHSIWQRYQKLKFSHKKKPSKKQNTPKRVFTDVEWSYPLVTIFINNLMKMMSYKDVSLLENQPINDVIWKKMEQEMCIDQTVLKEFWNFQLHMQLFCPKSVYVNDIKMDLIAYLYKNKTSLDTMTWDEVKFRFKGVTSLFLSKLFNHLIEYAKKELNNADIEIPEIVEYLFKEYVPDLNELTDECRLVKVSFENGILVRFPE